MPTPTTLYLVTLARDHTLKLHRSTCKKALANHAATPTDNFHTTLGDKTASPATCCKPRFVLVAETPPEPTKARKRLDVRVRFLRGPNEDQLRPMPDSQNKLASVAYYHTAGITSGAARISTPDLRLLLAGHGVADPEAAPWGPITLSNGVVLKAEAL